MSRKASPVATFVIMTAKDCGACTKFKTGKHRHYTSLLSNIKKNPSIKIVEIETPSTKSDLTKTLPSKYHPDLKNWCFWYPLFGLFTYDSWNNHTKPLIGQVAGLKLNNSGRPHIGDNGGGTYVGGVAFTSKGINEWVNRELKKILMYDNKLAYTPPAAAKMKFVAFTPESEYPPDYF